MRHPFTTSARRTALTLGSALLAVPLTMLLTSTTAARALADVAMSPVSSTGAAPRPGAPPAASPPVDGEVLHGFDPPARDWLPGHRGVDIAAPVGAPVTAVRAGVVTVAGMVAGRPVVVVQMADGRRISHLPVSPSVRVGQPVVVGQIIGTLAEFRHCSRPCLHWGLINGRSYQDPMSLLGSGDPGATVRLYPEGHRPRRPPPPPRSTPAEGIGMPLATGAGQPGSFLRPVPGPVSSVFGMRHHPVRGVWKLHDGVDLASPCGTPIRAAATGRVTFSGYHPAWGYRVVVDHGTVSGSRLATTYNHLSGPGTAAGAVVLRGQPIGRVGSTGFSTGCHLHLGMERNGNPVDPLPHLSR
ncbi:peptidoglycan DD-metalloendopeptidase family protein [Acidipropionibacterium jensenii]|uniref:peptidoglycan DD-metalloendopeptidase family protein n=1 Tax=Acidipropionibacterium jensenii TaxID=1749 RepID=UPI000BC30CF0|nr:peptidoglycan DD-metalloendopeptidase family protein [Acidipropionibacterium jensenii]